MTFESTNRQFTQLVFGTFTTLRSQPWKRQLTNAQSPNVASTKAHLVKEQSLKEVRESVRPCSMRLANFCRS